MSEKSKPTKQSFSYEANQEPTAPTSILEYVYNLLGFALTTVWGHKNSVLNVHSQKCQFHSEVIYSREPNEIDNLWPAVLRGLRDTRSAECLTRQEQNGGFQQ